MFKKKWKYKITGTDGNCMIFGVNIFDLEWHGTGETVKIMDPQYHQEYTFDIYTVDIEGQNKKFAAREFSNCVWGFYLWE